jgi:hypothetical protein
MGLSVTRSTACSNRRRAFISRSGCFDRRGLEFQIAQAVPITKVTIGNDHQSNVLTAPFP